jgi:hypothetical protein
VAEKSGEIAFMERPNGDYASRLFGLKSTASTVAGGGVMEEEERAKTEVFGRGD